MPKDPAVNPQPGGKVVAVTPAAPPPASNLASAYDQSGTQSLVLSATDVKIELVDDAPAVDPMTIKPGALGECRCGGLGVALIDEVMDEWRIEPAEDGRGNRLVLRKRIESWACEEADET